MIKKKFEKLKNWKIWQMARGREEKKKVEFVDMQSSDGLGRGVKRRWRGGWEKAVVNPILGTAMVWNCREKDARL